MDFRQSPQPTPRWLVFARAGLVAVVLLLLWGLRPAIAQVTEVPGTPGPISSVPGVPNPAPRATLILRADTLLLIGADGRERFAIAEDGSVELSGAATIDFSPTMEARSAGAPTAYVRVRMGGRLFVLQLLADPEAVDRGPGGAR